MTATLTRRQQRMLDQAARRGPEPPAELVQGSLFDYDALDTEARIVVKQRTGEIKTLVRRAAQDIIEIGQKLIEVKEHLQHGQFGAWLKAEFDWSERTALRFMTAANQFGNHPNLEQLDVAISALCLLAAPSTPEAARDEALARAEAGETITHQAARQIVERHKLYAQEALSIASSESTTPPDLEFRRYEPPIRETSDETALVRSLVAFLVARGEHVRAQVPCAAGVADVVSDQAVYEVKYWLTRDSFISAVGQVVLYRQSLNPALRAVVVGFLPSGGAMALNDLIRAAEHAGVEVLICNPS